MGYPVRIAPFSIVRLGVTAGVLVFFFLSPARAKAQAAPGPLPQSSSQGSPSTSMAKGPASSVPRTKTLAGTWRLNLDESDDPAKKLQEARGSQNSGQGRHRGGGMGSGWPGGGPGGGGGQRQSDSGNQEMHIFVEPSRELNISQKEPEIEVTDDDTRTFSLFTDNRKLEKSKDASHQELNAKWVEFRLVAEGKDPRGNKYERSYEVLEGNQQLRETLFLKVGRNNAEVSIRYVYDLVPAARPQPSQASQ
jgi:hypothetical protein